MPTAKPERRLTAIVSADVVGFSRLMAQDEVATLASLGEHMEIIDAIVRQHGGRVVNSVGDNVLAEFPSVVSAVTCAVEFQREIGSRNAGLPAQRRLEFRVGIHLGDVIVERDSIYGDGVNIAARLEALAEAGGIYVSAPVYDQVLGKIPEHFENLGEHVLRNIPRRIAVYRVEVDRDDDARETIRKKRPSDRVPKDGERRLRLASRDGEWVICAERPEVSFGRDVENDITLDDPYVSRRHGFVAYRGGDLVLVDRSSNGTMIRRAEASTDLHCDTLSLEGTGTILLGDSEGAQLTFAVETYCSEAKDWVASGRAVGHEEDQRAAVQYLFRPEGEFWTLRYEGRVLRLKDSKGLRLISHLMKHPGVEVHALDLASIVSEGETVVDQQGEAASLLVEGHVSAGDGAGPLLDRAAKADYKRRLTDLQEELDEAESFNDTGRVERARAEIEFLTRQLAEAVGIGGRDRPSASNAERARVMVTHRIRDTMKKIRRGHPGLGAHLDASIRTGTFCSYTPDVGISIHWSL